MKSEVKPLDFIKDMELAAHIEKNGFKEQFKSKYGFPIEEMWSLDQTIANFVYPRLVAFKETHLDSMGMFDDDDLGFCGEEEGFTDKLRTRQKELFDEMLYPFKSATHESYPTIFTSDNEFETKFKRGMNLFAKYFWALWW